MPLGQEVWNPEPLPYIVGGYGWKTPFGITLPPGGRVAAFVRGSGAGGSGSSRATFVPQDLDDNYIVQNGVGTIYDAIQRCRTGRNDVIVVLEGHAETITDTTGLSGLKAGTTILGVGRGSNMPSVRWTNTAASWLLNANDVSISGLRLRMEGANGITRGINVTGADCSISGCDIEVASGATAKAAIMCELTTTAANRFRFFSNKIRGTATHNMTNCLLVSAAVDQPEIFGNRFIASATAGNGLINFTAAALNIYVGWNTIYNTHTASTCTINFANVAVDGVCEYNNSGILTDGTANATGIVNGAASLVKFFQNFTSDEPKKSGALSPAVVAT